MKTNKEHEGKSTAEQIGMVAGINLVALFFVVPASLLFFFFAIFIIFDFFTARQCTIPITIVVSAVLSLGMTFLMDISRRIKIGSVGIVIALVAAYLVTVDIEGRTHTEEVVVTSEERKRINLDSECYDIGRSYGMAAKSAFEGDSLARDVSIPFQCRNLEATSRGIRAGTDLY